MIGGLFRAFHACLPSYLYVYDLYDRNACDESVFVLDPLSDTALVDADGERSNGNGVSFVACGSRLRSAPTVLIMRCLTKVATGVIKPGSFTTFTTKTCIKVLDCGQ